MDTITKKGYIAPQIELIFLDSEVSLSLESGPPVGPDESYNNQMPEYFNSNTFKTELG